jgi:UDP-glucose 4-epimerase
MSKKNIETCLVTGGAGFIGSHLVEYLLKAGYRVKVLDNFSSGTIKNLQNHLSQVELIQADICNFEQTLEACKNVDIVLHQAAIPSVFQSMTDPKGTHEVNVNGWVNVLESAVRNGVKKLTFASSAAVYGASDVLPKREPLTLQPVSPYGLHKLIGEQYAELYSRVYGLDITCLRYFNVFGPRQNPSSQYSGVISAFINTILSQKSPVLYGDGLQSRDFIHVTDICQANVKAIQKENNSFAIYNVGQGQSYTLLQLLDALKQLLGYSFDVEYQPERRGDLRHSVSDISLIKSELGFQPQVSFEKGLQTLISYTKTEAATAAPIPV